MKNKICLALICVLLPAAGAAADEGMWTYNNFPKQLLKEKYGFTPTDAWLDHVRLSSVRFNNGGSGSFVSPNGLVMTNHHVGSDCIQELGSAERDYMSNGFLAKTQAEEARCPNLELNVLMSISDVTNEVNTAVQPEMDAAARNTAQRGAMARLEKQCAEQTGLRCDVVVLYEGGVFNLYRYKKYTDVRLAFAPEADIAFFGGDPDNFMYPRYDLDVSFFRVYENNHPARIEHYLKWNARGPREGDLIFVSGNPGSTGRQLTRAQMHFLNTVAYPFRIDLFERRLERLRAFSAKGAEETRMARDTIFSYENSLKATRGYHAGLRDPKLMARREQGENELRAQVAAKPQLQREFGGAWNALDHAQRIYSEFYKRHQLLEQGIGLRQSHLFQIARHLLRMPVEKARPNEQRLREYRASNLASVEQDLFSPAPIYASLETAQLAQILTELRDVLGAGSELTKEILQGRTPEQAAERYVAGSKLADVAARRKLAEGGQAAVEASEDSMIRLARLVDQEARSLRKRHEDEVEGVERKNGSLLAKALFETKGASIYPEATFTLRLSFGAVKGYLENGQQVPYTTRFEGLYQRATGAPPFKLPANWVEKKPKLNAATPFNFVNTADIIGGNSGSPVVSREGELVGIIFDGNIQSLPNRFLYTEELARAVAVHSAGIIEALDKVYGATALLKELRPGQQPAAAAPARRPAKASARKC